MTWYFNKVMRILLSVDRLSGFFNKEITFLHLDLYICSKFIVLFIYNINVYMYKLMCVCTYIYINIEHTLKHIYKMYYILD